MFAGHLGPALPSSEPPANHASLKHGADCFYASWFSFWPLHMAYGILVPQPGIRPSFPEVEVWSFNHWSTREAPDFMPLLQFGKQRLE